MKPSIYKGSKPKCPHPYYRNHNKVYVVGTDQRFMLLTLMIMNRKMKQI